MAVDQVPAEVMAEMRAWAKTGTWQYAYEHYETSEEYVDAMADAEVLEGVEACYGGGAAQFARDMGGTVVDSVPD